MRHSIPDMVRGTRTHSRRGWLLSIVAILTAAAACTAHTHPAANAAATPAGLWQVTYGAPSTVSIAPSGSNKFTMTAHSPVTVVRASCQLAPGTKLATMTGTGSPYTGQHGLWSTATCSFAYWTSMTLRVSGNTATAQLGDGEHLTFTRQSAPVDASSHADRDPLWVWVVIAVLLMIVVLGYGEFRRRRRSAG